MPQPELGAQFERVVLPHLDAAFNLARWLTRSDHDAADVVQDALVKALRHFGSFRGDAGRPWFLGIVRNSCFTWLRRNRPAEIAAGVEPDDVPWPSEWEPQAGSLAEDPETIALRRADAAMLDGAIAALPLAFREALIMRELEELSYKEIADIVGVPIGTVMSRLARARARLRALLQAERDR